ncbi:uncharacterized protein LOC134844735 [Symsagittifera roscoffensis]|uniref:uncharacterized protein LOC134844735 n=1 Tax=Symsagittifera roscoffensis TaxID=84072 RepID=UPI00307B5172
MERANLSLSKSKLKSTYQHANFSFGFLFGCRSSKLVEPKTKDELDEIDNFFKSQLGRKNYWVGYAKIQMTIFEECDTPLNDAEFRSISDFSPIPEGMWKRSEPNNHRSQGEWCVESEVGKGLNDENCDNDNSNDVVNVALCEYNLPSAAGGSKKDKNDGPSESDESDEDDDATGASSEHDDAKKDGDSEEDEDDNSEEDDESNEDDGHNGDDESGEDDESNEDDENDDDDSEVGEDDSKDEDSDHSNTKKTPC